MFVKCFINQIAKIYFLLCNCSSDHDTSRASFVEDPINQSYSIVDGTVSVYQSSEDSSDEHDSSNNTHSDLSEDDDDDDDECLW